MTQVTQLTPIYYPSVFISDVHLGSKGCKARYLLDFLKSTRCDNLFLIGDIIDVGSYKRSKYWTQSHTDVINLILEKARTGTRVIYIPGNHDEDFRKYCGLDFGNVELHRRYIHELSDGRRMLLMHGDEFDHIIQCGRLLSHVGDFGYELLVKINRWLNIGRRLIGAPYWSFSSYLKTRVKKAMEHIEKFENAVIAEGKRQDVDGVICGHIHHANLFKRDGILYCNDGDWVDNCTTIVESQSGWLEILHWTERRQTMKAYSLAEEAERSAA